MTTRLNLPNLLPNTNYAIRLRAKNASTQSTWSQRLVFTTITDTALPASPQSTTWVSTGDSFHGEWDAVTENSETPASPITITRYEVELVANSQTMILVVPPITGSRVKFDLDFETNRALWGTPQPVITFRVRAVDNKDLKSAWSSPIRTATNLKPEPPTNVLTTSGVDAIDVKWDASPATDLAGYNVYVGTTAGFTPSSGNRVYTGQALRFTYTTTTYSSHYFKIRAVDKFGQESDLPDLTSLAAAANTPTVIDALAPKQPAVPTATVTNNANGIGGRATVNWTAVTQNSDNSAITDLAGYEIQWKRNTDSLWTATTISDPAATSTIIDLPYAVTAYDFRVRAFDTVGNYSVASPTLNKAATANDAPNNVSGTITSKPGMDSITYSWTPNTDADLKNYEVTFSTSSTFASGNTTFFTGTTAELTVSGLVPSTTYYARVRAVDIAGATSAGWTATNTTMTQMQSGTISASGPITLGPDANMVLNGGEIRSNTYTYPGQSGSNYVYSASATAGFYLGNDGLVIAQGTIKAEAFAGGTFSAGNIVMGSGGSISGGSWSLSSAGLSIPDGAIGAAKLNISSFGNENMWTNSSFEDPAGFSTGWQLYDNNAIATWSAAAGRLSGTGALISYTSNPGAPKGVLRYSPSGWTANQWYTLSYYARASSGNAAGNIFGHYHNTAPTDAIWLSNPALTTSWQRYIIKFRYGADNNDAWHLGIYPSNAAGSYVLDDFKLELGEVASAYSPIPSEGLTNYTNIEGGRIRTGSVYSTAVGEVWDDTLNAGMGGYKSHPGGNARWSLDTSGDATFSKMTATGAMVLGDATYYANTTRQATFASYNYAPGSSGFILRSDGTSEFRQVKSGSLSGDAISGNTLDIATIKNSSLTATVTVEGALAVRNPTDGRSITLSGSTGFTVRGAETTAGANNGPVLVDFPISGTSPNIIAGTLTASTLDVKGDALTNNAATLYKNNFMASGSTLTLKASVSAPSSAPSASPTYMYNAVSSDYWYIRGMTIAGSTIYALVRETSSTGVWKIKTLANDGTESASVTITTGGVNGIPGTPKGLMRVGTDFYVLSLGNSTSVVGDYSGSGNFALHVYKIPSATGVATWFAQGAGTSIASSNFQNYFDKAAIGMSSDGVNFWLSAPVNGALGGNQSVLWRHTLSNGAHNATYTGPTGGLTYISGIYEGTADFGGNRILFTSHDTSQTARAYTISGSALLDDTDNQFYQGPYGLVGIGWDTTALVFKGITWQLATETSNTRAIINYAQNNWAPSTYTARWGVAYTRTNSTNETTLSPHIYITMTKRAHLKVTTDSGSETATRIYVGRAASGTIANSAMFRQTTQGGSGTTAVTYSSVAFSGTSASSILPYPASSSSSIVNEAGTLGLSSSGTITGTAATFDSMTLTGQAFTGKMISQSYYEDWYTPNGAQYWVNTNNEIYGTNVAIPAGARFVECVIRGNARAAGNAAGYVRLWTKLNASIDMTGGTFVQVDGQRLHNDSDQYVNLITNLSGWVNIPNGMNYLRVQLNAHSESAGSGIYPRPHTMRVTFFG